MDFLKLPNDKWAEFFDGMTSVMSGKFVEVEVSGLDVGDQIESDWLPLNGISYEPGEDTLYVYTEPPAGVDMEHSIAHPKEVYVELGYQPRRTWLPRMRKNRSGLKLAKSGWVNT